MMYHRSMDLEQAIRRKHRKTDGRPLRNLLGSHGKNSDARLKLAAVSKDNAKAIEDLISVARKLLEADRQQEAKSVIKVIESLLNNNQKLQQVVGDALLYSH